MTDDILKAAQDPQDQPTLPPEPPPIPPAEIIVPPAPTPAAPPEPTAPIPPEQPKKSSKAPLVAILLFFLLSIPTLVYILNQRQKITTTPSQAAAIGDPCSFTKDGMTWTGTCKKDCPGRSGPDVAFHDAACPGWNLGCCANRPTPTPTLSGNTSGTFGVKPTLTEVMNKESKTTPSPTPTSSPKKDAFTNKNTGTITDTSPGSNTTTGTGSYQTSGAQSRCTPRIGDYCKNRPDQKFQGMCVFNHCPTQERCGTSAGCDHNSPGIWWEFAPCSELSSKISANECAQVDTVDTNLAYCIPNGGCDVPYINCSSSCIPGKPKPTEPPRGPQCNNIKIYKDGSKVTDLPSLRAGNQVVIAVAGSNAAKARIRIKEGSTWKDWAETATKNSDGEYTLNYTLPDNVTSYVIEAEVYQDGTWK